MFKKISSLIISLTLASVLFAPITPVFAQVDPSLNSSSYNDVEQRIESCNLYSAKGFGACFTYLYYNIIFIPSFWLASISGEIFDFFIQYSIDSNSYKAVDGGVSFVEKGWGIIRDLVNIMFLFILLYIAIKHILGSGGSATKSLLSKLIMIAIVINFSLFFTRIIVDAGNVFARVFYSAIDIENDDQPMGYTSISMGLMDKIDPQRILGSELLNPVYNTDPNAEPGKPDQGYLFLIMIMMTVVNLTLMVTFISVSLLLVGRVIGLWLLMIFSPIAFISVATPIGSFGKLSWKSWLDQVVSLSFMAPVFLFFIFLIIMFLEVIFNTPTNFQGYTTTQQLVSIIIPFILIILMLNIAKKQAKDMAGEAGAAVSGFASKALGGALGVASVGLGATAFLGRNTIGSYAGKRLNSGEIQDKIANYDQKAQNSNGLNKLRYKVLKKWNEGKESTATAAYNSNMDLRSGKAGQIIGYAGGKAITGINMATGGNFKLDLGKPAKAKDVSAKSYVEGVAKEEQKLADRRSKLTVVDKEKLEKAKEDLINKTKKDLDKKVAENRMSQAKADEEFKEKKAEIEKDSKESEKNIVSSRRMAAARTFEEPLLPVKETSPGLWKRVADTTSAPWWKVGSKERERIANSIRKGEKEKSKEDELADSFKEFLKEKKEKTTDSGGDSKDGGGGVKSGAAAPAGGGGGGESAGPKANFETEKVVDAIKDLGSDIRGAGNPTFSPGANINSRGGGFNTERTMAGFGDRGISTPNENSQPVGFKQNEDKNNS